MKRMEMGRVVARGVRIGEKRRGIELWGGWRFFFFK